MNIGPALLDFNHGLISQHLSHYEFLAQMNSSIDPWNSRLIIGLSQRQSTYIVMAYSVKHESLAKNGILTERQIEKVVIIWRKNYLKCCSFL